MKKVFLHIGTLKTGSSTIQNFLWDNSARLFPYMYLNSGLIKKERHIGVRHYKLYRNIENKKFIASVVDEINAFNGDGVVISYEGFVRLNAHQIEILKESLEAFSVKIIFYVRRQDKFIESLYLEYLKNHKYNKRFSDFISEPRFSSLCDYFRIANLWGDSFGMENIIVKNFEKNVKENNLIEDFLYTLGMCMPDQCVISSDDNLSLNISSAKFLASFNKSKLAEKHGLNFCRKISNNLIRSQYECVDNSKPVLFKPESRKKFVSFYDSENARLFDKFGCERFSGRFEDKQETDISEDPELIRYLNAMTVI